MSAFRRRSAFVALSVSILFPVACSALSSPGLGSSHPILSPDNAGSMTALSQLPIFVDCADFDVYETRTVILCESTLLVYPTLQSGSNVMKIKESTSISRAVVMSDIGRAVVMMYVYPYSKADLWDLGKGTKIIEFPAEVNSAAFSPDGKLIATTSPSDSEPLVRLWNSSDGTMVGSLEYPADAHSKEGFQAAFSNDGKSLAVGSMSYAYLWDLQSPEPTSVFRMEGQVVAVEFSPSDKQLVATEIGDVHVWDIASGKELSFIQDAHGGRVSGVRFSPDNSLLVTWGREDRRARVWDLASETERSFENLSDTPVGEIGFDPKGERLSIWSESTIAEWDTTTGSRLVAADLGTTCETVKAVSPDWRLAACETEDYQLQVWDVLGGKSVAVLAAGEDLFLSGTLVEFSPKGEFLLADFHGMIDKEYASRLFVFGLP